MQYIPVFASPTVRPRRRSSADNTAYFLDSLGRVYRVTNRPSPPVARDMNYHYYDAAPYVHAYLPRVQHCEHPACCADHLAASVRHQLATDNAPTVTIMKTPTTISTTTAAADIRAAALERKRQNLAARQVQTWWRQTSNEQKQRRQAAKENKAARAITNAVRRRAARVHAEREMTSVRLLRDLLAKARQLKSLHHDRVLAAPHHDITARGPGADGRAKANKRFLEYAHELDCIIQRVDQIDTHGSDVVRQYRRHVVRYTQSLLDALDRHAAAEAAAENESASAELEHARNFEVQPVDNGQQKPGRPYNTESVSEDKAHDTAHITVDGTAATTDKDKSSPQVQPQHDRHHMVPPTVRKIPIRFSDMDSAPFSVAAPRPHDNNTDRTYSRTASPRPHDNNTDRTYSRTAFSPVPTDRPTIDNNTDKAYSRTAFSPVPTDRPHTNSNPGPHAHGHRQPAHTSAQRQSHSTATTSAPGASEHGHNTITMDELLELLLGSYAGSDAMRPGNSSTVRGSSSQQGPQHHNIPTARMPPQQQGIPQPRHRHPHHHHQHQYHQAPVWASAAGSQMRGNRGHCGWAAAPPTTRRAPAGFYLPQHAQWIYGQ